MTLLTKKLVTIADDARVEGEGGQDGNAGKESGLRGALHVWMCAEAFF
jgi:hypothetical protein